VPNWTNDPPATSSDFSFRLVRVPAFKTLRAIILCTHLTGCRTHFFKGHTIPCEEKGCEACDQGLYYRWHAYVPAVCQPGGEKIILELTAQAAEQLQPSLDEYRTLRGIEIVAERPAKRPNGRIRITCAPGLRPETSLPHCPNVILTMQHIWGLDDTMLASTPSKFGSNRIMPAGKNGEDLAQNPSTIP